MMQQATTRFTVPANGNQPQAGTPAHLNGGLID
jgi:hypothetical protein